MVFDFLYLVATLNSPDLIVFLEQQCFYRFKEFPNLFNDLGQHFLVFLICVKAGPKEVFFGDEVVNDCWMSGSKNS